MIPNAELKSPSEPDANRFRKALTELNSNPSKAISAFEEMADAGSILSMLQLGGAYKRGVLVNGDLNKAEHYYKRAAESGSLLAYYLLGRLYLKQNRMPEVLRVFSYASGMKYAPATHYLGRLYLLGAGVTADEKRGAQLLIRAAQEGSVSAKGALARHYMNSVGHPLRFLRGFVLMFVVICEFIYFSVREGVGSDRFR